MVKLILDTSGYPTRWKEYPDLTGTPEEKKAFLEMKMLNALKNANPKLDISQVDYLDLKSAFSNVFSTSYSGLIVDEIIINERLKKKYRENGCQIIETLDEIKAQKIIAYVFLSANIESGRNVLFSQSIFPSLIDYMEHFLDSSSFSILNHPIYFINVINKNITAQTLIRRLALMKAAGINYTELFDKQIIPSSIPKQIESFMTTYEPSENKTDNGYDSDYINVNFKSKHLIIKRPLDSQLDTKIDGYVDFKGSSEKFYWMEVLFIAIIAINNGYTIDFHIYEDFINLYSSQFSRGSDKMARCLVLLEYFKKLSLKKKYHEKI